MSKIKFFMVVTVLGMWATEGVGAEERAPKVNGVSIPQTRIDLRVKASGQPDTAELRKAMREEMISLEVVGQEANRIGLNKSPDAVQQIELAKLSVLYTLYMQDYLKTHPVTDAEIKQEYERMKPTLGGTEVNLRHILAATEKEAKEIIALLDKGGDFGKLAVERSKDANTAPRGGVLGWSQPNYYAPSIANALRSLQKGGHSKEPVQSQIGWHVLKLDDVRERQVPALDSLKPQIVQRLQQLAMQKVMADLRAKAKIE